jgi:UDP-4-amino-4,6-dideoxy-N-acetyl-beta-L-altrosamine transaminase
MMPEHPNATATPRPPTFLPYSRHWLEEDDVAAVADVLRGDWLTQGPLVSAFEKALAEYCGARFALAVTSGTAALHLAALAAGVGPDAVGITSPITFVASANCIAYAGGRPAFADVEPGTVTLDPGSLAEACRRQPPRVIIPVDFAGQPADLPAVARVARSYGAVVIEDAAHALGASYIHERKEFRAGCCAHSNMAVLSFHPVKHLTTGEGGAVLTNDPVLDGRLRDLRSHGITRDPGRLTRDEGPWYYEQHGLGFNYRLTDIQCALGLSQLHKLPAFIARRRDLVRLYQQHLKDLADDLRLLLETGQRRSSYHLLVAQLRGTAQRRRAVVEYLHRRGIKVQVHYIPVHLQPWYRERFGFRPGQFPQAEAYYDHCLSLPLFPRMTDADVEGVCGSLRCALAESP